MAHSKLKFLRPILLIFCVTFVHTIVAQNKYNVVSDSCKMGSQFLKDPILDSLISSAIANNKNVLQAMDRISAARAVARVTAGSLYPQININGSWERLREGPNISETGKILYDNTAILEASTSWEIDVFGSIRKNVKSSRDLYRVSIEELNWVLISLCSDLAKEYINLRTYQQQYAVTQKNVKSQQEVYNIATARYEAGLTSKLDVLQANTVYLNSKAQLPLLQAYISQTINAIYILLGTTPPLKTNTISLNSTEFYNSNNVPFNAELLWQIGPIPKAELDCSTQIGLDIILMRPDIKSKEYAVDSYAALVGASKADWLPKFFLKGSIGYGSSGFSQLFNDKNLQFTVNPTISWAIFSGRALQEQTKVAKSNWSEAINSFNEAVITAMQEVDNAISLYGAYNRQVSDYKVVRVQARDVLALSLELYKQGLQDFQTVLDAQRSLYSYETALVVARGARINALIEFEKTLGTQIGLSKN